MNQISADHEKLRNVLISKLGLPTDRFQRDNLIAEAFEKLLHERDEAQSQISEITKLLAEADLMRRNVNSSVDGLIVDREGMREALQRIARACDRSFAVDIGYDELPILVAELLARPDATQPQVSETRYVLHGDIQPCSVLYSDDTTTLLRLDEGDMMLETDTIEWSDSVTYRCQELLKASGLNKINLVRVSGHLAQLVRDERILLNDNGDDESVEQPAADEYFAPTHDTRTEER